ncbi:unnamed protein product [Onchocerca flexuosa]|uniref:C2H2-type domain-containing protein n=1 Tax=Onchocerca flexuosa TaxID=387005 RepID=A0A183I5I4_9BILA|nr:unnamed protein product [Onchocerca flexuosa]
MLCGKELKYRRDLKIHELSHTGIKPFKCDECGREFSRKCGLRKHQKRQKDSIQRSYFAVNSLMTLKTEDIAATTFFYSNKSSLVCDYIQLRFE